MKSDTPETNEAVQWYEGIGWAVPASLAAKLERELTAAREKLAEWNILNGWGGTPEIINDFIKGQQTRIHYAQNLEEELTAVTEQRDRLAEASIRQKEIAIGLTDRDNLDIRVDWINALRTIVSRRLPKNKSGMSLISDIDLMLADDDERTEALKKIKAKYKL